MGRGGLCFGQVSFLTTKRRYRGMDKCACCDKESVLYSTGRGAMACLDCAFPDERRIYEAHIGLNTKESYRAGAKAEREKASGLLREAVKMLE